MKATMGLHTDNQNTLHVATLDQLQLPTNPAQSTFVPPIKQNAKSNQTNQTTPATQPTTPGPAFYHQSFDPTGAISAASFNPPAQLTLGGKQIKTREDLLSLGVPIPGFQGSTQDSPSTLNFGRRTYDTATATFNQVDPVSNGVEYNPMGNNPLVGINHNSVILNSFQDLKNPYQLNNQNSLNRREWDGYISKMLEGVVDRELEIANDPAFVGPYLPSKLAFNNELKNKASDYVSTQTITETIKRVYVPSYMDYIGSPEKNYLDNLISPRIMTPQSHQISKDSKPTKEITLEYGMKQYHTNKKSSMRQDSMRMHRKQEQSSLTTSI
jgi:hypothetical protein